MSETDPSHNHQTFPGSPSIFNPESLLNLKAPPTGYTDVRDRSLTGSHDIGKIPGCNNRFTARLWSKVNLL